MLHMSYLVSFSYPLQESVSSIERDHGSPSSELPRGTRSPVQPAAPAPAEWVRKERLGKKGEFRYF